MAKKNLSKANLTSQGKNVSVDSFIDIDSNGIYFVEVTAVCGGKTVTQRHTLRPTDGSMAPPGAGVVQSMVDRARELTARQAACDDEFDSQVALVS